MAIFDINAIVYSNLLAIQKIKPKNIGPRVLLHVKIIRTIRKGGRFWGVVVC